jgi:twinkle protein
MTGVCYERIRHEACGGGGLQVYANDDGTTTGFCWSCSTYVPDPYGDGRKVEPPKPLSEEEIEETLSEVGGYDTVDVPSRHLSAKDLNAWGIKTSLSESDGKTPTAFYCPVEVGDKVTGYYVKTIPQNEGEKSQVFALGEVKNPKPIGWNRAITSGSHTLIITEGFLDAVSVEKIFNYLLKKKEYTPAIVSLPNGVHSVKVFAGLLNELKHFKRVVSCLDNDEAGQKAAAELAKIIPDLQNAVLPMKDPNECLVNGIGKKVFQMLSFDGPPPTKNTRLVRGRDVHDQARVPTQPGELSWPFPKMNILTRRIRLGETIYIGADVKMGKSELLNAIASHIITEDGVPVLVAKPEETNDLTYKMFAGKVVGAVFHDPDVPFDEKLYDEAGEYLKDKLVMIDLYQHLGWETLRSDIIAAVHEDGVKAVFIDPITNLTNGMASADANTMLQGLAQEVAALAKDLNIVVFMFCHLKASDINLSSEARQRNYNAGKFRGLGSIRHSIGGNVYSTQFAASRGMMRSCHLMLGLEGNKDPDLPMEERNKRDLVILEDRMFGNSERITLTWDPETTLFKEAE